MRFYHEKCRFGICNGKKCERSYFITMRKAILRVFMVKLCQGRREETCVPFFVALMDVFQEPVFAYVLPRRGALLAQSKSPFRVP